MEHYKLNRRRFIQNSAVALALPSFPLRSLAVTTLRVRPEWQNFKITPQYDSLLRAIRLMRANTNANDPNSWTYWANAHLNRCPHGVAYFEAWHRGYLYYFERQLRSVSGDPNLVLPYWDYYTYSTIPAEFTNSSSTNPLYADRLNVNVRQALTLAPFSPTITNFPRYTSNAFEPAFENAPHNPVHDIIGKVMSTMQSPLDPIFWLHHANVDRLWVAWVAAGGGRKMPSITSSYWSGNHIYTNTLSMARRSTYDTRTTLLYRYQNELMPTSIPLAQAASAKLFMAQATQPQFAKVFKVQAMPSNFLPPMPPVGSYKLSSPRATTDKAFSVGGALGLALDRRSTAIELPLSSESWQAVQAIMGRKPATIANSGKSFRSLHVVLDNVELSEIGKNGGYYYQIFLNFASPDGRSSTQPALIGTLGAFQINGAAHHGQGPIRLDYLIDPGSVQSSPLRGGVVSISLVRVDGDNSPSGQAIGIGEARLELSTDDDQGP